MLGMAARGARGWVGLLPGGVLLALALLASGAGAAAAQADGPRADGAAAEECGAPAGGGTFDTPYWRDMHNSYGDGRFNRTLKYRNGYSVEVYDTAERLECSESWVNIPGVNLWNYEFQGFVYLCALIYCFLGIQIISDVFMSAVEVITASEKTVTINDTEFTVRDGCAAGGSRSAALTHRWCVARGGPSPPQTGPRCVASAGGPPRPPPRPRRRAPRD